MKKIAVVGSLNMDLVVDVERVPQKGETVLGNNFFSNPGGKGANQAVAAARLGGDVTFFGCVGNDEFGIELEEKLLQENVKPVIKKVDNHTGVALINVFDSDNSIIVASGANHYYEESYLEFLKKELLAFDIILFQLETSIELVEKLIPFLDEAGKTIILNPAPARKLSDELLKSVTYLTPNEHECQIIYDSEKSLEDLVEENKGQLIVTCGEQGVLYYSDGVKVAPPIQVKEVVDTTGAGDTFSGAFTYALSSDYTLEEAMPFANIAAGLSIQEKGAQTGMPTLAEVSDYRGEPVR